MRARIPATAKALRRFIDAYGYAEWIQNLTRDFDYDNLMMGLQWFANSGCPGCDGGGGMPRCEVRACCGRRQLDNCYFCDRFSQCPKLTYQRETYSVGKHHARIQQMGYAHWLREQDAKTKADFDNITYLEKRRAR